MTTATYRDGFPSDGHSVKRTLRPIGRSHATTSTEADMAPTQMAKSLGHAARSARKAVAASQERDHAIRTAHKAGNTIRVIAAVCGLSAARVHQILHKTWGADMTTSTKTSPLDAARGALAAHDALRTAAKREPRTNAEGMPINPDAWLSWHTNVYKPAYAAWDDAMTVLAAALGQGVGRHPFTFRPLCEQIIAKHEETVPEEPEPWFDNAGYHGFEKT